MSGVLVIPNQFAAAVTATAGAIDVNFNSVTAYINDPTNRNNYAADSSGATNTVNLTFVPPVAGSYTTGLDLTWKYANTNTGGLVVNANTIGNASLVNPDGSALLPGQAPVGSIGHGVYDGTRFINLSGPMVATKAMMQTATATSGAYVVPSQMINHPGVAKAAGWVNGTATGTIINDGVLGNLYGVSSVIHTGTGTYAFVLSTGFVNTQYVVIAQAAAGVTNNLFVQDIDASRSTNSLRIAIITDAGQPANPTYFTFTMYGTQ